MIVPLICVLQMVILEPKPLRDIIHCTYLVPVSPAFVRRLFQANNVERRRRMLRWQWKSIDVFNNRLECLCSRLSLYFIRLLQNL